MGRASCPDASVANNKGTRPARNTGLKRMMQPPPESPS